MHRILREKVVCLECVAMKGISRPPHAECYLEVSVALSPAVLGLQISLTLELQQAVVYHVENCDAIRVFWGHSESVMPVDSRAGRSTDEVVSLSTMRDRLKANYSIPSYPPDLNLGGEPRPTLVFAITLTWEIQQRICHSRENRVDVAWSLPTIHFERDTVVCRKECCLSST